MSAEKEPELPPEVPWTQPNGIYHDYDLHCHCGALRLKMKISPPLYEEHAQGQATFIAVECNCSFCERNGYHGVHPLAQDVTWTSGYADRGEYLQASKKCPQIFCKQCASVVATDLSAMMAAMGSEPRYTINVRMLKNYDPKKVKVRRQEFMKDMPPKYQLED